MLMERKFYCAALLFFWSICQAQQAKACHLAVGLEFLDSAAYKKKYGDSFNAYATSGVGKDLERMKRIALRNGHVFDTIYNRNVTAANIKKKDFRYRKKDPARRHFPILLLGSRDATSLSERR